MAEPTRCDRYRDLLETWTAWWNGPGHEGFRGYFVPPLRETADALACSLCSGVVFGDGGRCASCGRADR